MTRGSDSIISNVNKLIRVFNYQTCFRMKNLIVRNNLWYIIKSNDDRMSVENEEIMRCKKQRLLAMIKFLVKDLVIPYILEIDDP